MVQITTVDEAKQFYPLFGLGANVALVFSGRTVKYFSQLRTKLPPGVDGWGYSLKGMMGLVVILGLVIVAIYWWTNKYVVNDPSLPKAEVRKKVSSRLTPSAVYFTFFCNDAISDSRTFSCRIVLFVTSSVLLCFSESEAEDGHGGECEVFANFTVHS